MLLLASIVIGSMGHQVRCALIGANRKLTTT